jgi:dTDP-4-amino-4,6-dideoxygalactose transaminase
VLTIKLPHLDDWNRARAVHAAYYRENLAGIGDLDIQHALLDSLHVYHLFVITTAARTQLQQHLTRCGIQPAIHYPMPTHLQSAYANLGYTNGDFPQTERLAEKLLSLPMYPGLRDTQVAYIVERIESFFNRNPAVKHERVF